MMARTEMSDDVDNDLRGPRVERSKQKTSNRDKKVYLS
jgi:hypothetical protein